MTTPTDSVDVAALAVLFGVSTRYVYRLARMPGFPAPVAPGRYDPIPCGTWLIKRQRTAIGERGTSDGPALAAARLALMTAQAEKIATGNRVQRGELLERDALTALWSRRLMNCRQRLRAIPAGLGPTLTNKADPVYCAEKLRGAIDTALHELDGPAGGDKKPRRDARRRR